MERVVSCFHDETGEQDMRAGYYMVVMVVHDQNISIADFAQCYQERLRNASLREIPFHAVDLLHGHGEYDVVDVSERKKMLVAFNTFVRTLPVSYRVFSYSDFDTKSVDQLTERLKRDVESFLEEHLSYFQEYDKIAVYYDGGHQAVKSALKRAFETVGTRDALEFKKPRYSDKYLCQVADFICSIELAAMRYREGFVSSTYNKFFGDWRAFRANYLKQVQKKRMM